MILAFCLYKYFPFGGLQRDFMRIARSCQTRGHTIRVYVLDWQGEEPAGFEIIRVPVTALINHRRQARYAQWVANELSRRPVDRVVGFNKMPGLDIYFAADSCYEYKARHQRSRLYRFTPRYRHYAAFERAVFKADSATRILMLADKQRHLFQQYYATPSERFELLPPGINPNRRRPSNAADVRAAFRQRQGLNDEQLLVVQIGSGFKTKGLDRSLRAFAALPEALLSQSHFIAIGEDNAKPFRRLAGLLGIGQRVQILPGQDNITDFLIGADLLIHPAYNENAGLILLEALAAGLPVLTSANCGYAPYIEQANAGQVVPSPFVQQNLNQLLTWALLSPEKRQIWQRNGLTFAEQPDLYGLPERATDSILRGMRT